MEFDPRLDPPLQTLIEQQSEGWPLKFTHGDLRSLNILACGDSIVGIVDWETAGWYPFILGTHLCLPSEPPKLLSDL